MTAVCAAIFCAAPRAADLVLPSETRTAVCNGKIYSIDLGVVSEAGDEPTPANASVDNLFVLDSAHSAAANWVAVLEKVGPSGDDGLCQEKEVTFNVGYPVRQFASARELLKAQRRGEISVAPAERLLRYTVVRRLEKWPAMVPVESLRR